jgi:hypothetical protein
MKNEKEISASNLQTIPGVGPSIARDLSDLGFRRVSDLRRKNPEAMYEAVCALRGEPQDRCLLYIFRCAVYYAKPGKHDPEKLKWWNWKDGASRSL